MAQTTSSILPRPAVVGPCTCIWAQLQHKSEHAAHMDEQHERAASSGIGQSVKNTLSHPVDAALSAAAPLLGKRDPEDQTHQPEELYQTPRSPARRDSRADTQIDRNPISVDAKFGVPRTGVEDRAAVVKRMDAKATLLKKSGWLGKGRPFKLLGKTVEVKVGELISYREDLVYILQSFIPSRRPHDPSSTHPPSVLPVPHTPLCAACQQSLAHLLYHAPAGHSEFLRESSTSAFLALLDDANASLRGSLPMEHVSHHQLDMILRRELAVIEWRIAANLAKFHKKTGFLKEFPVRLGEFGEFQVNVKPPGAAGGFVGKIKSAVGLGGESASGKVQGAAAKGDES